jgi:hypothetical protein
MSDTKTNYATISAVDYRGLDASSTYNLSITPLTFFANVPTQTGDESLTLNNTEVTFDYGDGTIEQATSLRTDSNGNNILSAAHSFVFPGVYNVRMVLRDCNNNAVLASGNKEVQIEDYITNTFAVTCLDLLPYYKFALSAGEYSTPLTINSQTPFYQDFQDIYFSVSGTDCPNYFNLNDSKYNQLENYFSFYKKQFLPNLSGFQYIELTNIPLSSENIYVLLSGSELITSTTETPSSIIAGKSGTQIVYFKTQEQTLSTTPVYLSFYKDRNNIFSRGKKGYSNHNFLNNFTVTLSAIVGPANVESISAGDISISSNGLDNEGDELNSFAINPIQYKNSYIPFILKPKNQNGFTVNSLSAGDPEIVLVCRTSGLLPVNGTNGCINGEHISTDNYTITNIDNTLSSIGTDFWYRGVLKYDDSLVVASSAVVMNVELSARNYYAYVSDDAVTTEFTLTGGSNFSLYPKDYYSVYKVNEDFDFEQMIKDLRFQEILLDKEVLFTDFIGSIFGSVSSNNASLGKKLYESIINFVQNTSDIDVCNITALDGLSKLVDNETLIYNSNHPEEIKRLINLFSIQYNKFRGYSNQFNQNFDSRNRTFKIKYGTNLGDEVTFMTYVVSAGTDIVAYEKFSGEYTLLNSYQPILTAGVVERTDSESFFTGAPAVSTYNLREYNDTWGWPLVISPGTSGADIEHFYTFHEFTPGGNGTILNGVIDWNNPQTGIINTAYPDGSGGWLDGEPTHSLGAEKLTYNTPLSSLEGDDKIFDIMIRNSLFSSLSLFEG